ncbi:LutC/YkgG family protein [Agriterribacter sp.]|uniref:LutC/YkgG family protein n=1 Tax=Agriterribacter sp. TaxID=2821509 RepID=UPI002B96694F|nr:LUD domain-containing protein [Agriterribacter sp.]HTN06191.1 LUD domain-containing protein [Agriterribacter sp.]
MSSARKNILNRIESALDKRVDIPFPDYRQTRFAFQNNGLNLKAAFSEAFTALDGHLICCRGRKELAENLGKLVTAQGWANIRCQTPALLEDMELRSLPYINSSADNETEAGVTDCECLVARTGTIVFSASQASGRVLPVYSPAHLVIASADSIVFDIDDAIILLERKYNDQLPSGIFFASGPSRTADIEKRLVLGVHGPKEVYLFLMESELK